MSKYEQHEFVCISCNVKVFVETEFSKDCSDYADVKCPKCKRYVGEVKADNGYGILGTEKLN